MDGDERLHIELNSIYIINIIDIGAMGNEVQTLLCCSKERSISTVATRVGKCPTCKLARAEIKYVHNVCC